MRPGFLLPLALLAGQAGAAEAPAWWRAFIEAPRLETRFRQESESAVFGNLVRTGELRLARGGRLRVEYQKGLLLVADGATLVQYDATARTAQRVDLRRAGRDAPLLMVLLDPGSMGEVFDARPGPAGGLTLEPRKPGLPKVTVEGKGGLPHTIRWTDPTGAKQVLEFLDPRVPAAAFPAPTFVFQPPAGLRWIGK